MARIVPQQFSRCYANVPAVFRAVLGRDHDDGLSIVVVWLDFSMIWLADDQRQNGVECRQLEFWEHVDAAGIVVFCHPEHTDIAATWST
jgi:hypothetical protein